MTYGEKQQGVSRRYLIWSSFNHVDIISELLAKPNGRIDNSTQMILALLPTQESNWDHMLSTAYLFTMPRKTHVRLMRGRSHPYLPSSAKVMIVRQAFEHFDRAIELSRP